MYLWWYVGRLGIFQYRYGRRCSWRRVCSCLVGELRRSSGCGQEILCDMEGLVDICVSIGMRVIKRIDGAFVGV